jgi:hypothetical protein
MNLAVVGRRCAFALERHPASVVNLVNLLQRSDTELTGESSKSPCSWRLPNTKSVDFRRYVV